MCPPHIRGGTHGVLDPLTLGGDTQGHNVHDPVHNLVHDPDGVMEKVMDKVMDRDMDREGCVPHVPPHIRGGHMGCWAPSH